MKKSIQRIMSSLDTTCDVMNSDGCESLLSHIRLRLIMELSSEYGDEIKRVAAGGNLRMSPLEKYANEMTEVISMIDKRLEEVTKDDIDGDGDGDGKDD